ncbi:MAG: pilin [Patescibacteria group bacterium]
MNRKNPITFLSLVNLFFLALVFLPLTASAQSPIHCCRCSHPDVTKGEFCFAAKNDTDCANLGSVNNELLKASCRLEKNTASCQKITQGICLNDPLNTDIKSFNLSDVEPKLAAKTDSGSAAGSDETDPLLKKLNVDIPGFTIPQNIVSKSDGKTIITIPLLAGYINALQKFLLGAALIFAAVMIVWGGFKYIMAGMSKEAKDGKEMIKDALIGLAIVLSAYVILITINPNTAQLRALQVETVARGIDDLMPATVGEGMNDKAGSGSGQISGDLPNRQQLIDAILWAAKEAGVDDCALLAICQHESGFKWLWTGAFNPKNTLENAGAHGPCGTLTYFILRENSISKAMREKFPDMPPKGTSKGEMGRWLVYNPKAAAYYAAVMLKGKSSNPVIALDQYSSGGAMYPKWLKAHPPCEKVIAQNNTYAKASANLAAINECFPKSGFIAVPKMKCVKEQNGKCVKTEIDLLSACAPSFECPAKPNARAEFRGKCPNSDVDCLAMKMSDFIPYVLKHYPAMKSLGCTAAN